MPHSHTENNYNKAFGFGIILNIVYIIVEFTYGTIVNSMALIADAGHNLSDVLGLVLAWGASYLARTAPTQSRTYGMRKSTILASLLNAILLFIAVGAISVEAVRKFIDPEPVAGTTMIIVASIGVVINAVTAMLFFKGKEKDINIKGAFLHMAADAAVSLGVVIAGVIINISNWFWFDPAISLIIVIVITVSTWNLLKESFYLSMDAVPQSISLNEVKEYMSSINGVNGIHDLHIWAMSTTEVALTAHVVVTDPVDQKSLIREISMRLHDKFAIEHVTIQLEDNCQNPNCNSHGI